MPQSPIPLLARLALCGLAGACASLPPRPPPDPAMVRAIDRYTGSFPCSREVASVLGGVPVRADQVRAMTIDERRNLMSDRIQGWDAWVCLTGQPGPIVVSVDVMCNAQQVYTRGGASIPGLPSW